MARHVPVAAAVSPVARPLARPVEVRAGLWPATFASAPT